MPGLTFTNKNVRLDLRCTDKGGRQFVVEMQSYRQEYFFRRCVEYAAKVYDSGSARGDGQRYEIPPVYFIGILGTSVNGFDRSGPEWKDRYISEYTFREKITGEVPDETIFTIFDLRSFILYRLGNASLTAFGTGPCRCFHETCGLLSAAA